MTSAICFSLATFGRAIREKGTKVRRATSLVTHILTKKQAKTRTAASWRIVPKRSRRRASTAAKTPLSRKPPMTTMRQNKIASTGTLIYPT
jgi:hypothetical protein